MKRAQWGRVAGLVLLAIMIVLVVVGITGKIPKAAQQLLNIFAPQEEYCEQTGKTLDEMEGELDSLLAAFTTRIQISVDLARQTYRREIQRLHRASLQDKTRIIPSMVQTRMLLLSQQQNEIRDYRNNFVECFPEKERDIDLRIQSALNTALTRKIQTLLSSDSSVESLLEAMGILSSFRLFQLEPGASVQRSIFSQMQNLIDNSNSPVEISATRFLPVPDLTQPFPDEHYQAAVAAFNEKLYFYLNIATYLRDTLHLVNNEFLQTLVQRADLHSKYYHWLKVRLLVSPHTYQGDSPLDSFCSNLINQIHSNQYIDIMRVPFSNPLNQQITLAQDPCTVENRYEWLTDQDLKLAYINIFDRNFPQDTLSLARTYSDEANNLLNEGRLVAAIERYDLARQYLLISKQYFTGREKAEILFRLAESYKARTTTENVRMMQEVSNELVQSFSDNTNPIIQYYVADAYFNLENYDQALRHATNALLGLEQPELQIAALFLQSNIYEQQRKPVDQRRALQEIVNRFLPSSGPFIQQKVRIAQLRLQRLTIPSPTIPSVQTPTECPSDAYRDLTSCQSVCQNKVCGVLDGNPNCWSCECEHTENMFSTETECARSSRCSACGETIFVKEVSGRLFDFLCYTCA